VPTVRIRADLVLDQNAYVIKLRGSEIARGTVDPTKMLCMDPNGGEIAVSGIPTTEPVFGLPASWVSIADRERAESLGYTVVDAASVLATHLAETIRRHAHEILCRQDVQILLDNLKQTHPTVVNELIPGLLSVGQVQRVLQNLLAEGVSIRNLAGVLEKVADHATVTKNPDELSEFARRALGSQLTKPFQGDGNTVRAITIEPKLEQQIAQGLRQNQMEVSLLLDSRLARHISECLSRHIQNMLSAGQAPLVLCAPHIRLAFRRFFEPTFADLNVLSYSEIPARVEVQSAGMITGLE